MVGWSSGGTTPLTTILRELPRDLPASIFAVRHLSGQSERHLERILARATPLSICLVQDRQPIQPGCVYVAPPDRHLLVVPAHVRITRGPRENRSRPAIDALFRSAAVAYGPRVVGVLLSGLLNDGTAGLVAIKRCGGVAVVQDPAEAAYPEMVESALGEAEVDHCLPANEIAPLLERLAGEAPGPPVPVPRGLWTEVRIAEGEVEDSTREDLDVRPANLTCPDCGGPLSRIESAEVLRYRCRVGHAHTAATLEAGQAELTERALWEAIRSLEERADMLDKMAVAQRKRDRQALAASYEGRSFESRAHADRLRELVREGAGGNEGAAEAEPG